MTECSNEDIRDLLPDLLHGRLDGAARSGVEAHVRDCAECRREFEMLRQARAAAPAPRVDVSRIVAALPAPRHRRRWVTPVWRIAAAVIFVAVGGSSVATYVRHARETDSLRIATAGSHSDSAAGLAGEIELSVGYGYGDLTDAQLKALLKDVQQMNAVPLADPDVAIPTVGVGNGGV